MSNLHDKTAHLSRIFEINERLRGFMRAASGWFVVPLRRRPGGISFSDSRYKTGFLGDKSFCVLTPSICSKRSSAMGLPIGSRIKSMPSLRACFAAGTKSLSPAMSIIWSTCCLKAIEEISTPIRISTPFCTKLSLKSLCVKSLIALEPLISSFVTSGFRLYEIDVLPLVPRRPKRSANFRRCTSSAKNSFIHLPFSLSPKFSDLFVRGL